METGLGDTIHTITKAIGIKPCTPCEKRREKLNKLFSYDKVITVEVTTDMYPTLFPRGSVITIDKNHQLHSLAARLLEKGHLKLIA